MRDFFKNIEDTDEKSLLALVGALHHNNLPGFDYIEFRQALNKLSGLGMDETTVFKSAFATASTIGLTKEKLLETANHYKEVLAGESMKFDSALNSKIKSKISDRKVKVEQAQKKIEAYQEEIKRLEEQIKLYADGIETAKKEIETDKASIKTTGVNFEKTLNTILDQIDRDILNINQYL